MAKNKPFPNKIICRNVNGIRANVKKGAFDWILNQNSDIICLQETKAHPEQLDEAIRNPEGYTSYFDHSKLKKGYSGVAIYTKITPDAIQDSFPLNPDENDVEGRFYQIDLGNFVLINCYFPNGGGLPERLTYKLRFYEAMIGHIKSLIASDRQVIVCGDFNVVHKDLDAKRAKENQGNIGFLPEERAKLDSLVELGMVDAFRHFFPDKADVYTWWDMKSYARDRNIGWRIDTYFVTPGLLKKIQTVEINDDVYGSDHCPVTLIFK